MTENAEHKRLWTAAIAESQHEEKRLQQDRKEHFKKLADIGYKPKSNPRFFLEVAAVGIGASLATAALFASGTALSRVCRKKQVFGDPINPLLNSDLLVTSGLVGALGIIAGGMALGTHEEARYWGAQEQLKKLEEAEKSKSL